MHIVPFSEDSSRMLKFLQKIEARLVKVKLITLLRHFAMLIKSFTISYQKQVVEMNFATKFGIGIWI